MLFNKIYKSIGLIKLVDISIHFCYTFHDFVTTEFVTMLQCNKYVSEQTHLNSG